MQFLIEINPLVYITNETPLDLKLVVVGGTNSMRCLYLISVMSLCTFISACSIHPIPDDVVKDTTVSIVHKIRCEARQAMVDEILNLLVHEELGDENSRVLAYKLRNGNLTFKEGDEYPLNDRLEIIIDRFRHAGIAYTFTFTITENNNLTGDASLSMPFTGGLLAIGLNAGAKKQRLNERIVKLSDGFSDLVVNHEKFCKNAPKENDNYLYPITGNIGMDEVIATFKDFVNTTSKVGTFSDELTFTTALNAKVNPTVTLSKVVPKQLRLISSGIDANADRKDVHKVKLIFTDRRSKPPEKISEDIKLANGVFLRVPLPADRKQKARTKKTSGKTKGFFTIPPKETNQIKRDALIELERQEDLIRSDKLKELIGE